MDKRGTILREKDGFIPITSVIVANTFVERGKKEWKKIHYSN